MNAIAAFLGDPKGVSDWVDNNAKLPQNAANWVIHIVLGFVVLTVILTPAWGWIKKTWAERQDLRRRHVEALEATAKTNAELVVVTKDHAAAMNDVAQHLAALAPAPRHATPRTHATPPSDA